MRPASGDHQRPVAAVHRRPETRRRAPAEEPGDHRQRDRQTIHRRRETVDRRGAAPERTAGHRQRDRADVHRRTEELRQQQPKRRRRQQVGERKSARSRVGAELARMEGGSADRTPTSQRKRLSVRADVVGRRRHRTVRDSCRQRRSR